jgi:hypothetical protein
MVIVMFWCLLKKKRRFLGYLFLQKNVAENISYRFQHRLMPAVIQSGFSILVFPEFGSY